MTEYFYNRPLGKWPLFDVERRLASYKVHLKRELKDKGIVFDFHLWISDEWFCPDGVPGFALPAYLFNLELKKIHEMKTGVIEGRNKKEILKLMRHELGHAIDNAFSLRSSPLRRKVFGSPKTNYPDSYVPKAYSRNFVHYLGDQYAQSHPDEDFAETFAYWLDPEKQWPLKRFSKTLTEKLQTMDQIMKSLCGKKPVLKNRFKIDPIEKNKKTPFEYYEGFVKERHLSKMKRVDHQLLGFFGENADELSQPSLAQYLRSMRAPLVKRISREEGVYQYEANWALNRVIDRAQGLDIRGSQTEFRKKSPTLLQQSFRYLKEKDQLRFYL